jgi:hypothetical protein
MLYSQLLADSLCLVVFRQLNIIVSSDVFQIPAYLPFVKILDTFIRSDILENSAAQLTCTCVEAARKMPRYSGRDSIVSPSCNCFDFFFLKTRMAASLYETKFWTVEPIFQFLASSNSAGVQRQESNVLFRREKLA